MKEIPTAVNYINVCHYCGKTYYSNRSTSKYCTRKHNALFHKYGTQIRPVLEEAGISTQMDGPLDELYEECHEDDFESSWSHPLSYRCLREDYMYTGPLPSGEEYTLVGTYLIRAWIGEACDGGNIYAVKPFTLLTPEERRIAIIVPG